MKRTMPRKYPPSRDVLETIAAHESYQRFMLRRLMSFLDREQVIHKNECWNFKGGKRLGYGLIFVPRHIPGGNRLVSAHRLSYAMFNPDMDSSLMVLHHCDNPSCVNPYHLFQGTPKDNAVDCVSKGRHTYGESQHLSILWEEDIPVIRELRNILRMPLKTIAEMFGVTASTIHQVAVGKTWKHL